MIHTLLRTRCPLQLLTHCVSQLHLLLRTLYVRTGVPAPCLCSEIYPHLLEHFFSLFQLLIPGGGWEGTFSLRARQEISWARGILWPSSNSALPLGFKGGHRQQGSHWTGLSSNQTVSFTEEREAAIGTRAAVSEPACVLLCSLGKCLYLALPFWREV